MLYNWTPHDINELLMMLTESLFIIVKTRKQYIRLSQWMDKQIVVYPYPGIAFSQKKKKKWPIHTITHWIWKILYWAKENTKICMLYFPINIKLKNRQNWFMGKEIILLVFLEGGLSGKRHVKCYVSSYYSSKWNWCVFPSFIEPD